MYGQPSSRRPSNASAAAAAAAMSTPAGALATLASSSDTTSTTTASVSQKNNQRDHRYSVIAPPGCIARTILTSPIAPHATSIKVQLTMGFETGMHILLSNKSVLSKIVAVQFETIDLETPIPHSVSSGDHVYGFKTLNEAMNVMEHNGVPVMPSEVITGAVLASQHVHELRSFAHRSASPAVGELDSGVPSDAIGMLNIGTAHTLPPPAPVAKPEWQIKAEERAARAAALPAAPAAPAARRASAVPMNTPIAVASTSEQVGAQLNANISSGRSISSRQSFAKVEASSAPIVASVAAAAVATSLMSPISAAGSEPGIANHAISESYSSGSSSATTPVSSPEGKASSTNKSVNEGPSAESKPNTEIVLPDAPKDDPSILSSKPVPTLKGGPRRASISLKQVQPQISGDSNDRLLAPSKGGTHNGVSKNTTAGDNFEDLVGGMASEPKKSKINYSEFATNKAIFEKAIQDRNARELEGRRREQACYATMNDPVILQKARAEEAANPLGLDTILRTLLFFQGQKLVEENLNYLGGTVMSTARSSVSVVLNASMNTAHNSAINAGLRAMAQSNPQVYNKGLPLLKGTFAETVVMTVYQYYTNDSGFMSLETFVRFMSDSGIVNTHCPHTEFDEPSIEMAEKLDPVRLLTTIPKSSTIGIHNPSENIASAALQEALAKDSFTINFSQWYCILLKIAGIVYPSVFETSDTEALNKLLLESIVPLFIWCHQGHSKLGTTDPLVADERIALLLLTYAPNLWKVFLSYACDSGSKIPKVTLPYPSYAQAAETALFGTPHACPYTPPDQNPLEKQTLTTRLHFSNVTDKSDLLGNSAPERRMSRVTLTSSQKKGSASPYKANNLASAVSEASDSSISSSIDSSLSGTNINAALTKQQRAAAAAAAYGLIMTERRALQMCSDFGITNDLVPAKLISAIFKKLDKSKKLSLGRTITKVDSLVATQGKEILTTSQKLKSRRQSVMNTLDVLYKKEPDVEGIVSPTSETHRLSLKTSSQSDTKSIKRPVVDAESRSAKVSTGLSYCEFLEFLGHIAVHGMGYDHFANLFPTPFAKVLALLTVWGVADMKKLQQVLHLHVDLVL